MITFLLAHLIGDYGFQNNWIAKWKVHRWRLAALHAILYTCAYAFWYHSPLALLVIGGTHLIIDRYRLVKPFIWAINQLAPKNERYPFAPAMKNSGYGPDTAAVVACILMVVVDNTVHLLINYLAIAYL
jgi:hypothetical protein